jgi:hypothetical protein
MSSSTSILKQIQLRLVAEKAGFIDGQVLDQLRQFFFARRADQQAIVAVERIGLALLQAPQQTILQEVRAPLVEVHAAFLINQSLQQLQFRFGECGESPLAALMCIRSSFPALPAEALLLPQS